MHFTYCPHCGEKLVKREIGDEGLVPYCERCRIPLWDMFTTSILAAVINEYNEIVLLKQNYVSSAKYVCVAGIMKIGESAEDTVIREVKEEVGLDVDALRLGYRATVKKKDLALSGEVDAAKWVKLEEALEMLREGSIAWQLVKTIIEMSENPC